MAEFSLKVNEIDEAGKAYRFPIRHAWLAEVLSGSDLRADDAPGDGLLEVRAQKSGADVLVRGRASAVLVAACGRCLEPARIPVAADLTLLFTARGPGLRPEPDEDQLTPDEIAREFYDGDELVLDEAVRENLILEVPMQPLCADDCPGIEVPAHLRPPDDFGREAAAGDPRLQALKKIKLSQSEE